MARTADRPPVMPEEIRRMCDAIRHRGPDGEGIHVHDRIGIGMRRLSVIDLSGGDQPIYSEDGTKAIVFNGEIYNYRELRDGLLARGHRFRTKSDTETIVHLYEEHGAGCVDRLRGMFAFALWDETKRTLLLARDRFGIKPLYVSIDRGQITFASELKALLASDAAPDRLDLEALETFFSLGYMPAPFTPYAGIRKLQPGHVLLWKEDGSWVEKQYWDVPTGEEERSASPQDVLEWLDESVSVHLVSDVPLAVMLSGGLDSSAVFSSMAIAGAAPHAFTARYLGTGAADADETMLARQLADRYGARLTVVDIEPRVADVIESIMYALDEPHADESAVPTWHLSRAVAEEYKVVLAGTGGDELFGGYRRHRGLLASDWYTGLPASLRWMLKSAASRIPEPNSGSLSVHRLKRFLRTSPGPVSRRYFDMLNKLSDLSVFAPDVSEAINGSPAAEHLDAVYSGGGSPQGLKAALYMDYKTYLPDDILHLSDRIAMAHSLEVRVPLVDHALVDRAFPLPDGLKIGRGRAKKLLRQAIGKRLPPDYLTAKKRGFVGPTAMWLRNELRGMVMDELSPDRIGRLGLFDSAVVARLLDDHMSGRQNRESALWALLSFSVWHRVTLENGPARSNERPSTVLAL